MGKTSKGTQAASQGRLKQIQPNGAGGAGGGGGAAGPDPEALTASPIFGEPDYAPDLTFIQQAAPNDNGFIAIALQFHQNSGLSPRTVQSIEEMVNVLSDPAQSGTGIINRIRIVSHVFFDPSGIGNPTNMMLRFLTAGVRPSLKRHFNGFAGTSMDALKSMMTFEVGTFTNTTHFITTDSSMLLMNHLKPTHNAILALVPTDALGEATGEFDDFFKICGSKWTLQRGAIPNASVTTSLQQAYDLLLADVVSRIRSTIPEPQLNTLRDAILNLGNSQSINIQTPHNLAEYGQNLAAALTAIQGNGFLTKLNRVRQRINRNSKIDIRGCQVGRDPEFLQAMQKFFGTNATVRPAVSGPQWFQHFNAIGNITGLNSNALIGTLFNNGFAPYSAVQVRQHFENWATGFGITAAHLTFWQEKLGLNALTFSALQWRNNLPATTIPVTRLQAISSASFRDVISRLINIFQTPAADRPNNAALNIVDPLLPNLSTWATQLDAAVSATATPSQLTDHFNNYKNIYEHIDNRFTGSASPSAAQRIIPATPPASLTVQVIRDFQTALKNFIDTHANSRLRPIKRFMTATVAQTQDAPARMRYFLCLGLPFLLYNPAATNSNHNILIVFQDTAGADRRQNDAIKYWIRAQWRGNIPAVLGNGTTFDASRQTPWLVENHQPTGLLTVPPYRISPTVEFHDKIVIVNP
jgi:hypothetical protein